MDVERAAEEAAQQEDGAGAPPEGTAGTADGPATSGSDAEATAAPGAPMDAGAPETGESPTDRGGASGSVAEPPTGPAGPTREAGPASRPVDVVRALWARHSRMAGSLMAGAIAYRLFIVMLPLAVVLLAVVGLLGRSVADGTEGVLEDMGLAGYIAESIARSAELSAGSLWGLLAAGVLALLWAAFWTARALRTTYAMAWGLEVHRRPGAVWAMLHFVGITLAFSVSGAAFYTFARLGPLAAILSGVGLAVLALGLWWLAMWLLPHRPCAARELLPGAGVLTAGISVLILATGLFMWRLDASSGLYGPLGLALVLLFWLYLIGHLLVGAPLLNAELWERTHGVSDPSDPSQRTRIDEETAMAQAFSEAAGDDEPPAEAAGPPHAERTDHLSS